MIFSYRLSLFHLFLLIFVYTFLFVFVSYWLRHTSTAGVVLHQFVCFAVLMSFFFCRTVVKFLIIIIIIIIIYSR